GMGELHLEILVDRMLREFGVQANVGKPQVAYRETITVSAVHRARFVRQTGGKGMFADVTLRVDPQEPGQGFSFESEIVGGSIPKEFIPAIEQGVEGAMKSGVVPEEYMGDIIGDLSARRGRIGGMFIRSDARVIAASVPLSEMFGYATRMRSISQGRAIYSMQFSRYETLPQAVAEEIVAKVK